MLYFIIAICFSITIYLVFKYAGNREHDLFSIVLINYPVCVLVGLLHLAFKEETIVAAKPVIAHSAVMGILFISMFYLMGLLTKNRGVSVSSVVSRLSLVLPVLFFYFFYEESVSLFAIGGILLAIISILLISQPKEEATTKGTFWLPVVVFIGYGLVDIGLKLSQDAISTLNNAEHELTLGIFFFAGLYGWIFKFIKSKPIDKKSVGFGVLLGLVNYYSIYFFLQALEHSKIPSTLIFPINGIAILLGASLLSVLLFKEKLGAKKVVALAMAVLSIILLNS